MSDFVQTMKDWRRMCNTIKSCNDCPMYKEDEWTYVLCSEGGISSARPEVAEKVIAKWAAEHLEPVYPMWCEWLAEKGVVDVARMPVDYSGGIVTEIKPSGKMYEHIPADIAEKLGIEPKEDIC